MMLFLRLIFLELACETAQHHEWLVWLYFTWRFA